ncbi:MAG: undecaprenyldiphospho-muramoylpentapeptide beta-N-acetylglucosaminyltransferase [Alphaproteobacteria bacterium]|jgi:UDP-N-acetylglucosamine--N-acetylmuramyl-(pentapeptide) pyrophosphoryl-undecaprenol N-acetylglucosamine transferase
MQTLSSRTVILAAGGTGGHIFPAEALAEVLLAQGYHPVLMTDHRFFRYNRASSEGVLGRIPIRTIRSGSMRGGLLSQLMAGLSVLVGVVQAMRWLLKERPIAVVGFGGYPSFPTLMAAVLLHRKTILHEQNSVLGKANRLLAPVVTRIATSYRATQLLPESALVKTERTGNPVRAAIQALAKMAYPEPVADGLLRILVIGGSQGASVFSEIVPQAFAALPANLRARVRLDQQCRAREMEVLRTRYQDLGMQVDIAPFFADVAVRMAAAHLVISRAGASSVAELMVAARPSIFVPLPSATDNHQYHNAEAIEDAGGGWVMTQEGFTPEALAARLETFLRVPQSLTSAAHAMRPLGQVDAADKLASLVLEVAGEKPMIRREEIQEEAA